MKIQLSKSTLRQHIVDLAAAFKVELVMDESLTLSDAQNFSVHAMGAGRIINAVLIPEVRCETTYACGLHELGHAVAPLGQLRTRHALFGNLDLKLEEERAAWEWAKHYALAWTRKMQEAHDMSYGSHVLAVEMERRRASPTTLRPRPSNLKTVKSLDDLMKGWK